MVDVFESRTRECIRAALAYAATGILCIFFVFAIMRLWHDDLTIPLRPGQTFGQTLAYDMLVKNLTENGEWYVNRFLGAPGQAQMYDYPLPIFVHVLGLRLLAVCSRNYGMVLNSYFLLSFPLTAWSSLYVLRQFRVSYPAGILASVLFSLTPYHFYWVGLVLSWYYLVPLEILVALWLAMGEEMFRFGRSPVTSKHGKLLGFISSKGAAAIAICVLMAMDNPYHVFFGAWLILVAGIVARFRYRYRGALAATAVLLATLGLTFALSLAPNELYWRQHGRNPTIAQRDPSDAERYAFKMAQLVLPITGHRIPPLARLKGEYNRYQPVSRYGSAIESDYSSLGLIGSCGFLFLLLWLVFHRGQGRAAQLMNRLSILNFAAFLMGMSGGLGSLFALVVSPQLRSFDRISIFISFLSLFAIALLADAVRRRLNFRGSIAIWFGAVAVLLGLGVLDQTTEASDFFAPNQQEVEAEFAGDADFVSRIEKSVPAGSMVFQLPYTSFPEAGPVNSMPDYAPLRGYLHSRNLHWSYGAMRGRIADLWQRQVAGKPIKEMTSTLALAGFQGIYIDRLGFADHAATVEAQLQDELQEPALTSKNNRFLFFDLGRFSSGLREKYGDQWGPLYEEANHPFLLNWGSGCSELEGTPQHNWRWCPKKGTLWLYNLAPYPRKVVFDMNFATGYPEPAYVKLKTPWCTGQWQVTAAESAVEVPLTVPPGEFPITFSSDAKVMAAPNDPRELVFRIVDFRFAEVK